MSLIKVVERGPYQPNPEAVRRQKAEDAFVKSIGKKILTDVRWAYYRNFEHAPIADIEILLGIFDHYLTTVKPEIMALEGKFGWHGGKRRAIELPDGQSADSKADAGRRILNMLIEDGARTMLGQGCWLNERHPNGLGMKQFSFEGVRSFSGGNQFITLEKYLAMDKRSRMDVLNKHRFISNIEAHYKDGTEREEKFANALRAYLDAYKVG